MIERGITPVQVEREAENGELFRENRSAFNCSMEVVG